MSAVNCPVCNHRSMSILHKLVLGPLRTKACANCGAKLTVPLWTFWISLIVSIGPIPFWIFGSLANAIVVLVVALLVVAFVQIQVIPLVPRAT